MSKPLDEQARPVDSDETLGRFVACAPGFYDPEVYAPGREVTVTGTFAEPMSRKVGGYEYRFPVVKADTVYLWPKRPERIVYYNRWLDWPWGPEWGWGVTGWVEVPVPARVPPAPRPRR